MRGALRDCRYPVATLSLRSHPIETAQPGVRTTIAWPSAAAFGVAAVVTVLAIARRGAFFYPDSLYVGLGIAAMALLARRVSPEERAVMGASTLFAIVWLVRGSPGAFSQRVVLLPMTTLALVGAWRLGRGLGIRERDLVRRLLLAVACACGGIGLAGVIWRIYPIAMPHDRLWRATATFTYANALGLFLAMALPLALAMPAMPPRAQRLATFIVAAGLAATLSRGGFIAAGAGLIVARPSRTQPWHALVIGGLAGACAVVVGGPVALLAVVCGAVLACREVDLTKRLVVAGSVVALSAITLALATSFHSRLDGGVARLGEWSTAVGVFARHPFVGAGAERFVAIDRSQYTFFAHNEYLQIAAGGGMLGILLVGGVIAAIVAAVRRVGVEAWAVAALVALAVGGFFDFTWHLPAIGAFAGWMWASGERHR